MRLRGMEALAPDRRAEAFTCRKAVLAPIAAPAEPPALVRPASER